jgi:hypothetical protein
VQKNKSRKVEKDQQMLWRRKHRDRASYRSLHTKHARACATRKDREGGREGGRETVQHVEIFDIMDRAYQRPFLSFVARGEYLSRWLAITGVKCFLPHVTKEKTEEKFNWELTCGGSS